MRIKDWKHSQTNKECLLWLTRIAGRATVTEKTSARMLDLEKMSCHQGENRPEGQHMCISGWLWRCKAVSVPVCLHVCVCTCIYICVCVSVGRAAGARLGGRGKHTDPFSINGCHLLNILLFISLEKMTLKLCPSEIYQTWTGNRVYSREVRGELLLWHWPPPAPQLPACPVTGLPIWKDTE